MLGGLKIAIVVLAAVLPGAATQPAGRGAAASAAATRPVDHTSLARELVANMAKGDFTAATRCFDDTMKSKLPAEGLKAAWDSVVRAAGSFQEQLGSSTQRMGPYDFVFVTCRFAHGNLDAKVVFDSSSRIAGLFFVPSYQAPSYADASSFREEPVSVGQGPLSLPGTLTLPKAAGRVPAIVLVHGSGAHDRDEAIGSNKPFRDIAWGLASKGVAVLRYDKRTLVHPEQLMAMSNPTVKDEVIDDALAAAALLRQRPQIDPQRIYVLGHSLGGMLIPRIGKADSRIAGFVVLAGNTRSLEDTLVRQTKYLAELEGVTTDDDRKELARLESLLAGTKDPNPQTAGRAAGELLGAPTSYWLDLRGYQPAQAARDLGQPMLILQGQRDYQVTTGDFELWKKSLAQRQDVTFKLYPGLNHLFMPGAGQPNPQEYNTPGHVDIQVIEDIAGWIKGH